MKARFAVATILLLAATPGFAHRLDEYLQATTISLEKTRIHAQTRLTPGVAVFPTVFANIDADADGLISQNEQRAYAERVLRDLSLSVDGDRLTPRLLSVKFPSTDELKAGLGEIQLEFYADLPPKGSKRRLVFENHHQSQIAAYLVNCLVPSDANIRVVAQDRNYSQSVYQLDYAQAGGAPGPLSLTVWFWLAAATVAWSLRLAYWRERIAPSDI
jgi:hypothetical protein